MPKGLELGQKANILLQVIGGTFDYDTNISDIRDLVDYVRQWSDKLMMPQIGIAFPRGPTSDEYTAIFPRASFGGTLDPMQTNPHEKVNDILDIFMEQLDKKGFDVNPRVYIPGFSHGGVFAQKYSLIMPERVSAIAAGGMGGSFTMPLAVYDNPGSPNDGYVLDWEVGINDLESLIGKPFNDISYKEIFQLIYQGSEDYKQDNSFLWPTNHDMYTTDEINFLKSEFGDIDPEIEGNIIGYLAGLGFDRIGYEVWNGYGHEYPIEMKQASFDFLEKHMVVPESNIPPDNNNNNNNNTGTQSSSNGGGGGGCYAATHLMKNGRLSAEDLASLYDLRNQILSGKSLIHRACQKGVDLYYRFSPGLVKRLEQSPMEHKIDNILQLPVRIAAKTGKYLTNH